jgi:uncharacterized protein
MPLLSPTLSPVKQSVSLITLGVSDYARAKAFYEAIGWSPAMEVEDTAFFQANGVVLVLWSREKLATDMGIRDDGASCAGIALAHNVASDEEVGRVIEEARANGAEINRERSPTFYGGYAGGFRDLEGHVWEVAHNPGFGLTDDGTVILPGARRIVLRDPLSAGATRAVDLPSHVIQVAYCGRPAGR